MGANVEVVAPTPSVPLAMELLSSKWNRYRQLPDVAMEGNVRVHRPRYLAFPGQSKWASPHLIMGYKTKGLRLQRPDLIHAHFAYPQGMIALQLGRQWGVPTVLTLHGCDVNTYPYYNETAKKRFIQTVNRTTEVVAVSRALSERTKEMTGREPAVMPIGIDLGAFSRVPNKAEARHMLGLPEGKFLVLYVGHLVASKGIRELLAALRQIDPKEVNGVFVGGRELLDEVKRTPHVIAAGEQPNDRVALYMAACDVLVLPSYTEGLPTVLVEAGAVNIPVIATRVGGVPDLLADGRGKQIEPRNIEQIVGAIEELRYDREAAREQANRFNRHVREEYDVEANAIKLMQTYENTMRKHLAASGD